MRVNQASYKRFKQQGHRMDEIGFYLWKLSSFVSFMVLVVRSKHWKFVIIMIKHRINFVG